MIFLEIYFEVISGVKKASDPADSYIFMAPTIQLKKIQLKFVHINLSNLDSLQMYGLKFVEFSK